jgi:hypothetical protein
MRDERVEREAEYDRESKKGHGRFCEKARVLGENLLRLFGGWCIGGDVTGGFAGGFLGESCGLAQPIRQPLSCQSRVPD